MVLRPCIECGEPTDAPRCEECAPPRSQPTERAGTTARGYDRTWRKLSERARRLQPFCSDCGATADLTVDHSLQAWRRKAQSLPIRLQDVEVVCRPCNSRRGAAKPSATRGDTPGQGNRDPRGESEFASQFPHSETMVPGGER